jgi:hypothetical protein
MNLDSFIYLDKIRKTIMALPGVNEGTCFGTPAFYVNKKLLARLKEDGETLMVHTDVRDQWMKKNSDVFFVTDHYLNYPSMLIRLAKVSDKDLTKLLTDAWKNRANKTLLKNWKQ